MATTYSVPEPVRGRVRAARKRANYNNGGPNAHKMQPVRDPAQKLYNAIPNERKCRREEDGSFMRVGWSTLEEREKEFNEYGYEVQRVLDFYTKN